MFERYTEKARRVIFFARYECSQYGSPYIETEHLLLGLLREDKALSARILPVGAGEKIRVAIDARSLKSKPTSTSVDLPLSNEAKRVLVFGAEEADELGHQHIGPEHLLLGLLREETCFAAVLLGEHGVRLASARETVRQIPLYDPATYAHLRRRPSLTTVRIHGDEWNLEFIRANVARCREISWHWLKQPWRPRDIVVHNTDGRISFDLALADDAANFKLVKSGWTQDSCAICRWKLCESAEPERSTGYSNGRDWVCIECYEKFLQGPDYFSTSHPEIT
jgi:hypothetical protein